MANLRIAWSNLWSAAVSVLVASSEASALPATNTKTSDRTAVWRSATATTVQTIDIDLGSVLAVTSVLVANVKLLGTGVLELYQRGDAGTAGAAVLVGTVSTQDRDTRVGFLFFASQSHRHWQLKWTNPTSANDYAEVGYVHLGTYLEPTVNARVPMDAERRDPSVGYASVDGQQSFARRTKHFVGSWEFYFAPEADLTNLRSVFDSVGMSTPIFAVLDTSLAWTAWLLRFASGIRPKFEEVTGRYTIAAAWEEAR
jgi:hypothetical protein